MFPAVGAGSLIFYNAETTDGGGATAFIDNSGEYTPRGQPHQPQSCVRPVDPCCRLIQRQRFLLQVWRQHRRPPFRRHRSDRPRRPLPRSWRTLPFLALYFDHSGLSVSYGGSTKTRRHRVGASAFLIWRLVQSSVATREELNVSIFGPDPTRQRTYEGVLEFNSRPAPPPRQLEPAFAQ